MRYKYVTRISSAVAAFGLAMLALPALAQSTGPDYSAIQDAIDWSAVQPILIAAGGALALIFVLRKGVKLALSMIK